MLGTRWGGFATGLIGVLVGALLVTAMPAVAGDGDTMTVGQKNTGKTVTRLNTRGGLRIDNFKSGNPALILNVADPSSAPMEVNGTGLVINLNADEVDGWDANELTRATFDAVSDAADTNGNVVSADITAPTNGYLLLAGGLDAFGGTTDYFTCELHIDGVAVAGSSRSILVEDQGGVHTANSEEDCSSTGAKLVGPGTYTVSVNVSNRETAQFFQASVWALFVPFDGTGTVAPPPDQ